MLIEHRSILRLVCETNYIELGPTDRILMTGALSFDASTFEIWGALLNGARILVVPNAVVLDAQHFGELLRHQGATVLWMTIGLFTRYAEELGEVFGRLRYLLVGGDVVEPGAVRRLLRNYAPSHLLNGYGPTECTTFSATYLIKEVGDDTKTIPIGRPISNARIYILDSHLEPVPIGVAGEIFIGGAGVALGYLNRPELTAERFIPDRFSTDPQARLYQSGDLGRWRTDGNVEFLGRNDGQVKLRGFRIELGEIEVQLVRHVQVKEATVIAREDAPGEKRLVAYVVCGASSTAAAAPSAAALRVHLQASLPDYMVPSAFVLIERLPLTPHGKLDRRALPVPEIGAYVSRQYEAPQGTMEEALVGIWKEVLRVERVGRDDNFFEIGGHSLTAMKLIVSVAERFATRLTVVTVFQYPTVRQMAQLIEMAAAGNNRSPMLNDTEYEEIVI